MKTHVNFGVDAKARMVRITIMRPLDPVPQYVDVSWTSVKQLYHSILASEIQQDTADRPAPRIITPSASA